MVTTMLKKTLITLAISCALLSQIETHASESNPLQMGELAIANGHINQGISLFQQALQNAKQPKDRWLASTALAEALIRSGQLEKAEDELNQSYQAAKTANATTILGEIELRLGHLQSARNETDAAKNWYQQALNHALSNGDHELAAAADINLAKLSGKSDVLKDAQKHIAGIADPETRNQLQLALAYQAMQQEQTEWSYQTLQSVSTATQNQRIKAQAQGYLGQLYEKQNRYPEALQLTNQALLGDNTADLHLLWSWQQARIFASQGNQDAALTAYRSAVQQIQNLRVDIPVVYANGESSFKSTFAPVYISYIELLLQKADKNPTEAQTLLAEVIQTWEQLKAVELQDYFRDACSVKQKALDNQLDAKTAVFYPILLSDHLALILRTKDSIHAYSVNKSPTEINKAIDRLSEQLLNGDTLTYNKTLYRWLIEPLEAELQKQQIDTLVYLPDGGLRKIPFAILQHKKEFLIDRYALVTTPGLSMLANMTDHKTRQDILLAGMSEPGPVVEELLDSGIELLPPPKEEGRSLGRGLAKRALYMRSIVDTRSGNMTERNLRASQLKTELALPGVSEELKTLAKLTPQPVMENTGFLLDQFKQIVNQGHSAIHIASHGYFSGDPKKSFIMTYDHLLNMEELSSLFQTEAFHDKPVELVTLSACQTAEGDDRSPLGLSGVVVQTGVKSAVGTLWPVADEAARQFFSDFYMQYQQPGMTKAKAMQYAQKRLMRNKELEHPAYWGPFVLVGEWH